MLPYRQSPRLRTMAEVPRFPCSDKAGTETMPRKLSIVILQRARHKTVKCGASMARSDGMCPPVRLSCEAPSTRQPCMESCRRQQLTEYGASMLESGLLMWARLDVKRIFRRHLRPSAVGDQPVTFTGVQTMLQ